MTNFPRSTLRMIALALAGILVAAAVAVVAGQLASRQIGLASEPVSAGDDLAPAVARPSHKSHDDSGNEGKANGDATTPRPTHEAPAVSGEEPAVIEPPATAGESPSGGEDSSGSEEQGRDD